MAAQKIRLVRKKCRFFDFNWLTWQRPLKNQEKLNGVIKPFHMSTNPEILVKIGLLASEPAGLRRPPLKNRKTRLENAWQSLAYSPLGKLAGRAIYSACIKFFVFYL